MGKITVFLVIIVVILLGGGYYFSKKLAAPPPEIKKIAVIVNQDDHLDRYEAFKKGMARLGYEEGVAAEYVLFNSKGDRSLTDEHARQAGSMDFDLIAAGSTSVVRSLLKAGANDRIPVVFLSAGNPGEVVENPLTPEANITGVASGVVESIPKRVDILRDISPGMSKLMVLAEKDHGNYEAFVGAAGKVAEDLGLELVLLDMTTEEEFFAKLPLVKRETGDGFLFFFGSNTDNAEALAERLAKEKIPSITHDIEKGANVGVLVAFGTVDAFLAEQAASLADQILNGIPVSRVPVELTRNFLLEINLKTAREIGIEIPNSILLQATKTYEE